MQLERFVDPLVWGRPEWNMMLTALRISVAATVRTIVGRVARRLRNLF